MMEKNKLTDFWWEASPPVYPSIFRAVEHGDSKSASGFSKIQRRRFPALVLRIFGNSKNDHNYHYKVIARLETVIWGAFLSFKDPLLIP